MIAGQVGLGTAGRHRHEAGDLRAVPGGEGHRSHRRQFEIGQLWPQRHQLAKLLGRAIETVVAAGIDIRSGENQLLATVPAFIEDIDRRAAGERLCQRHAEFAECRIEEFEQVAVGDIACRDRPPELADAQHAVDIDMRVRVDQHVRLVGAASIDREQRQPPVAA